MRWLARITLGLLALLVLVAAAGVGVWIWKPWRPALQMADPGETGRRIEQAGLVANYYSGPEDAAGVVLLGGSEGGLGGGVKRMALSLQEAGFAVLQVAYYRAPGQPANLELVLLESIGRGLDWLSSQPGVDGRRIGIVGGSKGAEAALLIAARRPEVAAVAVGAPSSVVWTGINWNFGCGGTMSSWSADGEPLPALPYGPYDWEVGVLSVYQGGLELLDEHPDAVIPVERISAPVLLICGEADALWPSCPMARRIEARAAARGGPEVTLLAYESAGHAGFGAPVPADHPGYEQLAAIGGTVDGNAAAREESWPRLIEFLESHLGDTAERMN